VTLKERPAETNDAMPFDRVKLIAPGSAVRAMREALACRTGGAGSVAASPFPFGNSILLLLFFSLAVMSAPVFFSDSACASGEPGLVSSQWRMASTQSAAAPVAEGEPSWSSAVTSVDSRPGHGWAVTLSSTPHGPPLIVAVNKDRQQLFMLEQRSPLSLKRQLSCSTGERVGDKVEQGDLKTPEGVYFVQEHLRGGLDYDLYGTMAQIDDIAARVPQFSQSGRPAQRQDRLRHLDPRPGASLAAQGNQRLRGAGQSRSRRHGPVSQARDTDRHRS